MKISILLPFRSAHVTRKRNLDYVTGFYKKAYPDAEYIVCDDDDPKDFNRGRAVIQGVQRATGDVFIIADADYVIPPTQLEASMEACLAGPFGFVVPYSTVSYLHDHGSISFLKHEDFSQIKPTDIQQHWTQQVVGGINLVTRENYFKVGGFDPAHRGWGFEDASFFMAMETLVAPTCWTAGPAVHLYHPVSRNPHSKFFQPSWDHCRLYEEARGDKEKMLRLVGSRISGTP